MIIDELTARRRLADLAADAAESDMPMLATGCAILLRCCRLSEKERGKLAAIAQLLISMVDERRTHDRDTPPDPRD